MFNIIDSTSALELIDEVTESDDVPPLATPEVSNTAPTRLGLS